MRASTLRSNAAVTPVGIVVGKLERRTILLEIGSQQEAVTGTQQRTNQSEQGSRFAGFVVADIRTHQHRERRMLEPHGARFENVEIVARVGRARESLG